MPEATYSTTSFRCRRYTFPSQCTAVTSPAEPKTSLAKTEGWNTVAIVGRLRSRTHRARARPGLKR